MRVQAHGPSACSAAWSSRRSSPRRRQQRHLHQVDVAPATCSLLAHSGLEVPCCTRMECCCRHLALFCANLRQILVCMPTEQAQSSHHLSASGLPLRRPSPLQPALQAATSVTFMVGGIWFKTVQCLASTKTLQHGCRQLIVSTAVSASRWKRAWLGHLGAKAEAPRVVAGEVWGGGRQEEVRHQPTQT